MKVTIAVKILVLLVASSLFSGCAALNRVSVRLDGMPAMAASAVSNTYSYITTANDGNYDGELIALINKRPGRQYIIRIKKLAPAERPYRARAEYVHYIGPLSIKKGRKLIHTTYVAKIWMSPPFAPRIVVYTEDGKKKTINNAGPGRVIGGKFVSRNVLVLALPPGRYEITKQAKEGVGFLAQFGKERAIYVDLSGNHPKEKKLGNLWVHSVYTL